MKPQPLMSGVALLEALVALGMLALVLTGLLSLQLRSTVDGQLAVQRVLATRLAQDLFERIKANPGGPSVLQAYLTPLDRPGNSVGQRVDCGAQPCGPQALAAWDLDQWLRQGARDLPLGQAIVFLPEGAPGQVGVLLGWRAHEATAAADYRTPLSVSALSGGASLSCPERLICQLLYSTP